MGAELLLDVWSLLRYLARQQTAHSLRTADIAAVLLLLLLIQYMTWGQTDKEAGPILLTVCD